ncbi:MAG TPA: metallophosphoesterase [Blastocatellia bacterium]
MTDSASEPVEKQGWWTRGRMIFYGLAGCGLLLAIYAFVIEPNRLVLRETAITVPAWPEEFRSLRIAVFSDLHAGSPHITLDKIRRVVDLTNAAKPDLILLPGDFVIQNVMGGKFIEPEQFAAELKNLKARDGVFATLGNHDWWYNAARIRQALEKAGIRVLENQVEKIERGGKAIWLAGFADLWEGNPKVADTLNQITDNAPVIAFTHNPDLFPAIPSRVALTIAGHSHGGQVALPLIGRPVVPSKYGQRYAIGHIVENGRHLFVTSGIGTSIFPVRFGVPPEISVITIN